jgi:excisionase family DNA binding protein
MSAERLLTTQAVADWLGLSSDAVLRLWRAGDLPGFRLSTRVLRFRESELMEWLEERRLQFVDGREAAAPSAGTAARAVEASAK